jgi:superfamily II DNA or RNA helicase
MVSPSFFESIQKKALPGVWAQGLKLARERSVQLDQTTSGELRLRVKAGARAVASQVTLWPDEDDAFCDCGSEIEPCIHVVACVIALKNQWIEASLENESKAPLLEYHFIRTPQGLRLERMLRTGERSTAFRENLLSYVGGVRSGRLSSAEIPATQADLKVDALLRALPEGLIPESESLRLMSALSECARIYLDSAPIRVAAQVLRPEIELLDERGGVRVRRKSESTDTERFPNAIARRGDTLYALARASLTSSARACLSAQGVFFEVSDLPDFLTSTLPELENHVRVDRVNVTLPELQKLPGRLRFHLEETEPGTCLAVAHIVYGDPPVAEVIGEKLRVLNPKILPERDAAIERKLSLQALEQFGMTLNRSVRLEASEALKLREKIRGFEVIGRAAQGFELEGALNPAYSHEEGLHFRTSSGKKVGYLEVAGAFDQGQSHLRLSSGSWAKLPTEGWSELRAEAERLLLLQPDKNPIARFALASLVPPNSRELDLDPVLRQLMSPPKELPIQTSVELRSYQKQGVAWLHSLENFGALLADDMGLGKTLQALCVLRGRTLVVAPSSILNQWKREAERFRADLKVSVFHGSLRDWSEDAQIVITSYGLLRQQTERFTAEEWDYVLLDEAHTIKNPESQTAQSAFQLRARTRIALTGTPIENRLDDLWSLFHFLAPTLLPPRAELKPAIARARTAPFILRRTKAQVAKELPPKTEIEIEVELSSEERRFYQSILAASQLELENASPLSLLEALLRLRQACCDPTLVPGAPEAFFDPSFRSSKLTTALEHLRTTVSEGHRTLVFSQWTSLLDRMESLLAQEGISTTRLDGSTQDRDAVVTQFQAQDGPPVFLISLKAGGVGLNLTRADHVLLLDPWWNPTSEAQAADRAYRIGQEKPVFVYRLITENTVESHVRALQDEKVKLSLALLEGTDLAPTREDLIALIQNAKNHSN